MSGTSAALIARPTPELIGATTSRTGLTVQAEWGDSVYPLGTKISDKQLAVLPLRAHDWHREWNYTFGDVRRRSSTK
jgi:hypothetical protein